MNKKSLIYLDYASTHPRKKEVMEARAQFELTSYANVGRGRYDLADSAQAAYDNSKKKVADWIGCEPVEVLYTYSATYALNILALALEHNGVVGKGDTILLSISEHHANIVPWQMMAERVGASVWFVEIDENYCLNLDDLRKKLDDTVKVVSFQYASNVTGALHPLEKIREIIGTERLFCVDASQMGVHGPLSMKDIQCDAMVFSGHKMMADTGIGILALWKVLQKSWESPISGGGAINFVSQDVYEQAWIPDRWEPGTPHITGAVSLSAAIDFISWISVQQKEHHKTLTSWVTESFETFISRGVRVFHSPLENSLGVWSFVIPNKHENDIADMFSDLGICVRSGHHCCEPLHASLGIHGSVRVSIWFDTTQEEMERFFAVLESFL